MIAQKGGKMDDYIRILWGTESLTHDEVMEVIHNEAKRANIDAFIVALFMGIKRPDLVSGEIVNKLLKEGKDKNRFNDRR
jgi:hypothetical protein